MNINFKEILGDIDIYLFDQLQKDRFNNCTTILDAGCGYGRNLHYFLRNDFTVCGADVNPEAIKHVQALSERLSKNHLSNKFIVCAVEDMPFAQHSFDVVISSAVLHFASNHHHFDRMLQSCWNVLKPGGYFFARLASSIGIEDFVKDRGNGKYLLPDGSERYLVDLERLLSYTTSLNGELFEPIKTTNVQNQRCMTTWCLRKN